MKEDKEGFLYPKVDDSICVQCGICDLSCPAINQQQEREPLLVYAAINQSDAIVSNSTSGGVFSLFAEQIIKEGGVVFGAQFDRDWNVEHNYCTTLEGLSEFRKSKYVQSKLADTYITVEKFLKEGRKVLFSGTPCQISGLFRYLKIRYENLITVDFICHGTPSPKVWRMYREEIFGKLKEEEGEGEISSIDFRDKKNGWANYDFVLKVRKTNDQISEYRSRAHDDLYMKGFLRDVYLRPSCYDCPSKSLRSGSDFTIADFWGVEKIMSDIESNKGVSLLMINSNKTSVDFSSGLNLYKVDFDSAVSFNPSFRDSVKVPRNRKYFFRKLDSAKSISRLIEKSFKLRITPTIISLLGMSKTERSILITAIKTKLRQHIK